MSRLKKAATTGIALWCSDPRLADPAVIARIVQDFKDGMGVDAVIPLPRPGIVGLYADPDVINRPRTLEELIEHPNPTDADIRRIALELEIGEHIKLHNPSCFGKAAHSDCKGHPGDDDKQQRAAIIGAEALATRLRPRGFQGVSFPAMIDWLSDDWRFRMLRGH